MSLTPAIRIDRDTHRRAVAEPSDAEYVADPANPVRPASTINTVSGTLLQGEEQQRGQGLLGSPQRALAYCGAPRPTKMGTNRLP